MSWAGQIQYHFGRNISPETTSPGQSASSELTNVVPAPPKVLEMDWNQTEVKLYVRRRANLSKFCWYVTFWKFPSHSKILQTLTEGCGNRLSICQVRCVAVFVAPSYYISWHVQIERRWHCLVLNCVNNIYLYLESGSERHLCHPNMSKKKGACTALTAALSNAFGYGFIHTASFLVCIRLLLPGFALFVYMYICAIYVFWFLYTCIRDMDLYACWI